ncbi:class I SAM-dependent methyltransferase [Streptomyces sp. B-S-A8]|uniref:Class I SAM-dependent methyltransferase n=1 Tax=Streptomyces solicavernae TaxID=3043614 RepID=A0ABT6S0S7_9ACTN|nr:class I SAM-dependent methyltransferase [Streptomyces sp. B-S-A8]MDI3389573.1 class I SAM-dependent methyltransferase [Streptomyces sp. B-S-A8]
MENHRTEPHRIADAYTITLTDGPALDEAAYESVIRSDFQEHYADGRDIWTEERAMREVPRLLVEALSRARGGVGDAHVLDVGTGRGRDAEIVLAAGHRVTGIDLVSSPEWAVIGRREPGRARFLAVSASELEETGVYNAVLDNGCLHHQHPDGYPRYLRRIRELLCPGGLFTVSVFEAVGATGRLYTNGGQRLYREFTAEELHSLVTAHGFETVATHRVPRDIEGLTYLVGVYRVPGSAAPGTAR